MLFNLLRQDDEEGDVLRRIASCIQNLASMRRCASDLTDYIADDHDVSNVLGTLFRLLARGGARNMHQRVMATFANLAYLCVSGDASTEWVVHLRYSDGKRYKISAFSALPHCRWNAQNKYWFICRDEVRYIGRGRH